MRRLLTAIFAILLSTALCAAERETLSLDCGGGVKLELVKIPAGKFIMGTPDPEHQLGYFLNWSYGLAGLCALIVIALIARAIIKKKRFQISILSLLFLTALAGSSLGMYFKEVELRKVWAAYVKSDLNDKPSHEVEITQPFYMGRFEVTQEQYQAVTGHNPSQSNGPKNPVDTVSWKDARDFCKKMSEISGQIVRLPTDAEWEYACRAGTNTRFYLGNANSDLDSAGWHGYNSGSKTHPVGGKKPNLWGLYDMHGNVYEWCGDWYENYDSKHKTNPQGPANGSYRVLRGGSYNTAYIGCLSANRYVVAPDYCAFLVGFRVVVDAPTGSK